MSSGVRHPPDSRLFGHLPFDLCRADAPPLRLRLEVGPRPLRPRRARVDEIDRDPRRPELDGERLRQVCEGGVAQTADGPRLPGGQSADVDDPPPSPSLEVGGGGLRAPEVADDLRVYVGEELLLAGLFERSRHQSAGIGRVVDEYVDPAELPRRGLHHSLDRLPVGGVGDDRKNAASRLRRHAVRRLLQGVAAPGADGDVHPFPCQLQRDRLSDPLAASRHDRSLAAQLKVHLFSLLGE